MAKRLFCQLLLTLSLLSCFSAGEGCSRVFFNNPVAKVVARSMDLNVNDLPRMVAYPRGIEREGRAGPNSVEWKSKYGSLVITAFNQATSDGMNEKGLAAHLLYLHNTKYEERDERKGLANSLWIQYFLDNFATVQEALDSLQDFQVISTEVNGQKWPLHAVLEDATGDSAILEYIDGKQHVHHGKEYVVATNDPIYQEQAENLKRYKLFGGDLALPGDVDSQSRFVRASSFLKTLPQPKNEREAIARAVAVIRTVMVPRGAVDTSGHEEGVSWPTLWLAAADTTHKIYYFNSTLRPNTFWIELVNLDFSETAPLLELDPHNPRLAGDVSKLFTPVPRKTISK